MCSVWFSDYMETDKPSSEDCCGICWREPRRVGVWVLSYSTLQFEYSLFNISRNIISKWQTVNNIEIADIAIKFYWVLWGDWCQCNVIHCKLYQCYSPWWIHYVFLKKFSVSGRMVSFPFILFSIFQHWDVANKRNNVKAMRIVFILFNDRFTGEREANIVLIFVEEVNTKLNALLKPEYRSFNISQNVIK